MLPTAFRMAAELEKRLQSGIRLLPTVKLSQLSFDILFREEEISGAPSEDSLASRRFLERSGTTDVASLQDIIPFKVSFFFLLPPFLCFHSSILPRIKPIIFKTLHQAGKYERAELLKEVDGW